MSPNIVAGIVVAGVFSLVCIACISVIIHFNRCNLDSCSFCKRVIPGEGGKSRPQNQDAVHTNSQFSYAQLHPVQNSLVSLGVSPTPAMHSYIISQENERIPPQKLKKPSQRSGPQINGSTQPVSSQRRKSRVLSSTSKSQKHASTDVTSVITLPSFVHLERSISNSSSVVLSATSPVWRSTMAWANPSDLIPPVPMLPPVIMGASASVSAGSEALSGIPRIPQKILSTAALIEALEPLVEHEGTASFATVSVMDARSVASTELHVTDDEVRNRSSSSDQSRLYEPTPDDGVSLPLYTVPDASSISFPSLLCPVHQSNSAGLPPTNNPGSSRNSASSFPRSLESFIPSTQPSIRFDRNSNESPEHGGSKFIPGESVATSLPSSTLNPRSYFSPSFIYSRDSVDSEQSNGTFGPIYPQSSPTARPSSPSIPSSRPGSPSTKLLRPLPSVPDASVRSSSPLSK